MTEHSHSAYVEGCYRCELSRDEVAGAAAYTEWERDGFRTVPYEQVRAEAVDDEERPPTTL